jgi:hypothetical protein
MFAASVGGISRGQGGMVLRRWAVVVGLVLAVVALQGCTDVAGALKALQGDPMASVELPGALESRHSESAGNVGPPVPAPAEIQNSFTVPNGGVPAGMDALADVARQAGWNVEVNEYGGFRGQKTIEGHIVQLAIEGIDADGVLWIVISTRDF